MQDSSTTLTPYFKITTPASFNWYDDIAQPLDEIVRSIQVGNSIYIVPNGVKDSRIRVATFHDYENQVVELNDLLTYNQKRLYASIYPEVLSYLILKFNHVEIGYGIIVEVES